MLAIDQHMLIDEGGCKPSKLRFLDPRFYFAHATAKAYHLRMLMMGVRRRQGWFLERLTLRKAINMVVAGAQWGLKSRRMYALPPAVKIDISPMCNLSCTMCLHADPNDDPALEKQRFDPKHRMPVDQYRRIIREIKGRVSAVSLYYFGDPLVHPDLDEMSSIARDAGLNVHISTNFSFSLTDARLRRMVKSGLTHISVCVDGLSQEMYERTRVGGRIDKVLHNLERVCRFRKEYGLVYPKVEVQYIKFRHNVHELEPARKQMLALGVDQFTDFWGELGNCTEADPEFNKVLGPRKRSHVPLCFWPHTSMVIKHDGDVVPCCTFRIGHQYSDSDDSRALGNVFKTSLTEVWNNAQYHQARQLVADPSAAEREPGLKKHFCYACPALYETTDKGGATFGNNIDWEDLYSLDADGRPVAKRKSTDGWKGNGRVVQIGLPNGEMAAV